MPIPPLLRNVWSLSPERLTAGEGEAPLRAELFGVAQLARHAAAVAAEHRVGTGRHSERLLDRLDANEKISGPSIARRLPSIRAAASPPPAYI